MGGDPCAAKIRIQLPPGSTTVNPAAWPVFFRLRGRVIRGMPEISNLPCTDRIPSANGS